MYLVAVQDNRPEEMAALLRERGLRAEVGASLGVVRTVGSIRFKCFVVIKEARMMCV